MDEPNEPKLKNPCVGCGACCANFRVQFYWREANPGESPHARAVPKGMFEELTALHRAMKGTAVKHRPHCVGLAGKIGRDACCTIYDGRPTPCREFTASFADGVHRPRCDQARAAHGLAPLKPENWKAS